MQNRIFIKDLNTKVGEEIIMGAWVDVRRDQGKMVFFDARDMTGKVQCVVLPNHAEAIEKANNTPFGLSAGVWSEKGSRILWATQQLRAGVVWANTFNKFDPASPFGGYKESGWGREGGKHGLAAYLKEGK